MYNDFYQLKENPFNVTSDPDFFFSSQCHADAILNLVYGIEQRKGILVITGEIGTGKTTLCRKLLRQFDSKTKFALILNPSFSELQLLQIIAQDLGIQASAQTKVHLIQALNKFLLKESSQLHNVVLIIDEAQNLSVNQLEQIRLLSNFETEKEKLLQIILVGQPEFYDKLQLPELRQLRQRITINYHLKALDKNDIKKYIDHRIDKAIHCYPLQKIVEFTEEAINCIYRYTQGSPRTINILCDRALLAEFAAQTHSIDEQIIESCAKEVLHW
jgi:general secretion pathway protein A